MSTKHWTTPKSVVMQQPLQVPAANGGEKVALAVRSCILVYKSAVAVADIRYGYLINIHVSEMLQVQGCSQDGSSLQLGVRDTLPTTSQTNLLFPVFPPPPSLFAPKSLPISALPP